MEQSVLARGALKPSLPTEIIPAKIPRLKLSGRFPMDLGIPPLKIKIMLEQNVLARGALTISFD